MLNPREEAHIFDEPYVAEMLGGQKGIAKGCDSTSNKRCGARAVWSESLTAYS